MKKVVFALVLVALALLTGCSQPVPPAHLGKVLDYHGYTPDVYPPGRVGGFHIFSRKKLILLETGTQAKTEAITVRLADKVELTFDVRFRTRIAGSDQVINAMFNDITPDGDKVTLHQVYLTYGQMIVRNKAREVVGKYTVEDISANYSRISAELMESLVPAFAHVPLEVSDVALGNIDWPKEVTDAVNATAKARAEIAKIEADKAKDIADASAREAIAEANYNAQMVEARTIRDYNKTIAEGISEEFLRFKALQLQEEIAKNGNGDGNTTVYLPYDALGTIGAQQRMFGK